MLAFDSSDSYEMHKTPGPKKMNLGLSPMNRNTSRLSQLGPPTLDSGRADARREQVRDRDQHRRHAPLETPAATDRIENDVRGHVKLMTDAARLVAQRRRPLQIAFFFATTILVPQ